MNYRQHFSDRISSYLTQLKGELDQDLPRLGELVPEVTIGAADSYIDRVAGLVDTYHGLFHQNSKPGRKNGGMSYYQRQKQIRGYDAHIEEAVPAILEKEGYLSAPLIHQYVGIEVGEAEKRLKALSKKHKWRTKADPQQPEMIRYLAARPSRQVSEAASPGKGESS